METNGNNTGTKVFLTCGALFMVMALCIGTVMAVLVWPGPQISRAMGNADFTPFAIASLQGRFETENSVEAPAIADESEIPSLEGLGGESAEPAEPAQELPAADPQPAEQPAQEPVAPSAAPEQESAQAPATSGESDDGYSGITPPFIPNGGPVDTSNPIPLPPGLPSDFPTMSLDAQTAAMSSLIGLPLIPVEGEEGVAWNWNGNGVTTAEVTCPEWIVCHLTLVDGNATVLYRGHGVENDVISAGTFRVERQIPGRGGLCFNSWMAQVYEASIVNILHILGEANECPTLPAQLEERINPELHDRLVEVMEKTGANGVISIGTVKNGFGAFVIVSTGGPETLDSFTCFDGAVCAVDYGDGFTWVEGPVEVESAQSAVLYILNEFDSVCEAYTGAVGSLGSISNGPSCE